MNHQTKAILKFAKEFASDEGVFSADQCEALKTIIDLIGEAIKKETEYNKRSY